MPITGPASYLPTLDHFIPHWTAANAELGAAGPIVLAGSMTVAGLTTLRDTLESQRAAVEVARNGVEGTRANIEGLKAALLERLNQFNDKLESLGASPVFLRMRAKAYSQGDGMGRVIPPLDGQADVWARYEAAEPAMTLRGGYTRADFLAEIAALKAAYQAHGQARHDVMEARAKREATQEKVRTVLVQYRKRIAVDFAEGSAIHSTLPAYSPADTGRTPDAVTLSGGYDPAESRAELAWSEVTDEDVTELELRATAGPEYEAEDESTVATFAPDAPREWAGLFGLHQPGTAATFKLYALTATGRERGSNPVTVTRPL
jgi:hypothetical protein